MEQSLTPDDILPYFTSREGTYFAARWGRPIVPVVFGVEEETLRTVKGAIEAVVTLAGHSTDETDTELGANLMMFFFRDWDELLGVPNLEKLIDNLPELVAKLGKEGAHQYRAFRFDNDGAIQTCVVFVRMSREMSALPAETIALSQAVQMILVWSDQAFAETSPLGIANGNTVLKPDVAAIIRAAYDPVMPVAADDASHALRLFARVLSITASES